MEKYRFSDEERYAVYTVGREKCYICHTPLDLITMEVDHIIPEKLLLEPERLLYILEGYGLPADYNLQSFANWAASCGPCNNRKRDEIFEPTPFFQLELQRARRNAVRAEELSKRRIGNKAVGRAWNAILRAASAEKLDDTVFNAIQQFASFHLSLREPEMTCEPIRLTPLFKVISETDRIRLVEGPYGVGAGPINPTWQSGFRCSLCGNSAWNGARCVICGQMDDD